MIYLAKRNLEISHTKRVEMSVVSPQIIKVCNGYEGIFIIKGIFHKKYSITAMWIKYTPKLNEDSFDMIARVFCENLSKYFEARLAASKISTHINTTGNDK